MTMYIFELITKLLKEKNNIKSNIQKREPDYEDCEHIFLPLDSTGEVLACRKCGVIVQNDKSKYKKRNPFND